MGEITSWNDIRASFEKHAQEYDNLAAERDWSGRFSFSKRNGSPRAERLFREIAAQAAAKLALQCAQGEIEPWELWLEYMRSHGWRRPEKLIPNAVVQPQQRRPFSAVRAEAERGERTSPRIFQTSADCCKDLEEREQSNSVTNGQQNPAAHAPTRNAQSEESLSNNGTYDPVWRLKGGGSDAKTSRERFSRLARRAMVALGERFTKPAEAVDAWLNRVHEFHAGPGSEYAGDHWHLTKLPEASAGYCDELRTRGEENGDDVLARLFLGFEKDFRDMPDLSAILRGTPPVKAVATDERLPATRKQDADLPKHHPARDAFLQPCLLNETRNAIAEGADFSPSSLQRWHEGKSRLRPDNLSKLAKYLNRDAGVIPNN